MAREHPPDTQDDTGSQAWSQLESQPIENIVWGRLYGKNVTVKTLELCHEKFSTGRGEGNDLILTLNQLPEKVLQRLSKVHFEIRRENCDLSKPVYIQDFSRNGTYVNDELIGTNRCRILKNNDVISLMHPKYKAFVFRDSNLMEGQDLPNEITSKYYVSKNIGSGAFGMVRLVYDRRTCIKYAMKHVIKDMFAESTKAYNNINNPARVMNEAKIMKELEHPCVIKMHDIVDKPDSVYMVLEFMEGGDLLHRITSKKHLSDRISKLFIYQMCHAVKYLHDNGITHRDLKPDNVLLSSSDEETLLKVSDFGLSKYTQHNSVMRTVCGTPQYVAPEVLLTHGRGTYTKKVDIWSLGVVMFTCLSGTLPFHDDYGSDVCDQIRKGKFKFNHPVWNTVPENAKKLIAKMLTVDPIARPSIDYVLGHSWLRDPKVVWKAKSLMKINCESSDEENFLEPPQKRSKPNL